MGSLATGRIKYCHSMYTIWYYGHASSYGITVSGKHAVVMGRSNIVGKPMGLLLLTDDATVTICPLENAKSKSNL